jgi:hypothetical protein
MESTVIKIFCLVDFSSIIYKKKCTVPYTAKTFIIWYRYIILKTWNLLGFKSYHVRTRS